jgi:hypothetical protein
MLVNEVVVRRVCANFASALRATADMTGELSVAPAVDRAKLHVSSAMSSQAPCLLKRHVFSSAMSSQAPCLLKRHV